MHADTCQYILDLLHRLQHNLHNGDQINISLLKLAYINLELVSARHLYLLVYYIELKTISLLQFLPLSYVEGYMPGKCMFHLFHST